MSVDVAPPSYLTVQPWERGRSLGIDSETFRCLARTSLAIIEGISGHFMGIYRAECGCCLDIFSAHQLFTIRIDSEAKQLALFLSDLDSTTPPLCIFSGSNAPDGWRELGRTARKEILQ